MKTIDKLKSILEESDEQFRGKIRELITEMEKKEDPKLLDEGWCYDSEGVIRSTDRIITLLTRKRGAIRPAKKEAEYAALVNELWNKRTRAQDILCPGFRFIVDGVNWHVVYDNASERYTAEDWGILEDPLSVYFDTKDHALEAEEMFDIKELRDRVRTFWE